MSFIASYSPLIYLISAVLFILSLKGLSSPETARRGLWLGILGMALAVLAAFGSPRMGFFEWLIPAIVIGGIIGSVIARRIAMTDLPQLVALLHSFVGLAAVLVAKAAYYAPLSFGIENGLGGAIKPGSLVEMYLGDVIGALTFSGSLVAFGKLQGLLSGAPLRFRGQHLLNALLGLALLGLGVGFVLVQSGNVGMAGLLFWAATLIAFILGVTLIMPIGGADMPVVVSMLNSYSGWAAAGVGFTLNNSLLIIAGALIGASGAILSYIMCKAMNRSFLNVLFGGFGTADAATAGPTQAARAGATVGAVEDAAFMMKQAQKVIIVPGYGMAVAQAQHAVREMGELLAGRKIQVRYAIHPVAGRMPGHMNVLLADAKVPYDQVFEMEEINNDFADCDVVYVIGANDVTNPAAKDPQSPIYGMPILEVERARTVIFVKRSLGAGYAGVDNELFYRPNTMMLLGDGKKVSEALVHELKG